MSGDPRFPLKFKPTFAGTQGAQMVAAYINTFLFGVGFFMSATYFHRHAKNDSWVLKSVVLGLVALATLETTFTSYQSYQTLIVKWGKPELLDEIVFSVPGKYACVYFTAFIAQLFFASRIWMIGRTFGSRMRFIVFPVIVLSLLQLAGGLIMVIRMVNYKSFLKLSVDTKIIIEGNAIQAGGAAAGDILITLGLVSIFHSHRSGIRRTNSILEKLIIYTINRALATSVLGVLSVFLYFYCSGTFYFMIPLLANTHVYLISVVTILVAREGFREELDQSFHSSDLVIGATTKGSEVPTASTTEESSEKHNDGAC